MEKDAVCVLSEGLEGVERVANEHNGAKLECRPRSLSLTSEDYFMSTIDNFNFVFL